jgi:hypothetical protein
LRANPFSTPGVRCITTVRRPVEKVAAGHRAYKAEEHCVMASWQAWKNRAVAALVLGAASSGTMAATPALTAIATPSPVVAGSPLSLALLVSDIVDLYAFQVSLSFNPALLQLTSVSEGAFLLSAGPTTFGGGTANNTTGTVTFLFDSLFGALPGATGTGVLANLQFTTVAAGVSPLTFSDALFLDSGGADITVLTPAGSIQVTAVPEPASYALFALGLAGLAITAKRRVQAA